MITTAEGVETEEQLAKVKAEGYTEIQGYYFSPPRPAKEMTERYFPAKEDKVAKEDEKILFDIA